MNLTNEFRPIRDWAAEKGIYRYGDTKTQTLKLLEESGELAKAILNQDKAEIKDAIGDIIVVLTSVAVFAGFDIEECINAAYYEIKNRQGKMDNGTFIKEHTKTYPIDAKVKELLANYKSMKHALTEHGQGALYILETLEKHL